MGARTSSTSGTPPRTARTRRGKSSRRPTWSAPPGARTRTSAPSRAAAISWMSSSTASATCVPPSSSWATTGTWRPAARVARPRTSRSFPFSPTGAARNSALAIAPRAVSLAPLRCWTALALWRVLAASTSTRTCLWWCPTTSVTSWASRRGVFTRTRATSGGGTASTRLRMSTSRPR